ncbi:hypothetical protein SELMODRAFT_423927 [Selaginella moellendorffii]|uniref:Uncharacterized protein n=1 Tax=Selaginella moellendorffii TaxID=88036 RepID=D8SN91_SELML|nr:hypothetical protein SELMODRAFT_423927 [Selaginella moellendorffii]
MALLLLLDMLSSPLRSVLCEIIHGTRRSWPVHLQPNQRQEAPDRKADDLIHSASSSEEIDSLLIRGDRPSSYDQRHVQPAAATSVESTPASTPRKARQTSFHKRPEIQRTTPLALPDPGEGELLDLVNKGLQQRAKGQEIDSGDDIEELLVFQYDLSPLHLQDPYIAQKQCLLRLSVSTVDFTPRDVPLFWPISSMKADNSLTYADLIQGHEQDSSGGGELQPRSDIVQGNRKLILAKPFSVSMAAKPFTCVSVAIGACGCSMFLLWDDIVKVRPKMVMILVATVMLWSLGEKAKKAANIAAVLEHHIS